MRVDTTPVIRRLVGGFNSWMVSLRASSRLGPLVSKYLTIVTYTGRRSGRTFSTPVAYRRKGDVVTIGVRLPDAKNWWRNFTGEGGPITLELDGRDRTGHATAQRDKDGRVEVTVRLDA